MRICISARETAAALRKEPPQRGTPGVGAVAALHAAARPQRSRMARAASSGGSAAGRPPRRRGPEASCHLVPPSPPSSPARRPPLRLSGSRSHLGEEAGKGPAGRAGLGRSSKVQLFARGPPAAWPRALCNAAVALRAGGAKGGRSHTAPNPGTKQVLLL